MKNYLDNILKGFKPVGSQVMLDSEARQTPNFVVVDIDQDGMPELLFAYQSQGERYIGILKKENTQWYLFNVSLEKNQKAIGLGNLVHILDGINLTSKDVGKVMSMEDLLGTGDQAFVSFVDNTLNHGVVMQTPAIPSNFNPLATTFSKESIIGNLTVEETGMTAEQIIQQSGSLQSPENVNTPQAQQALSQNVITPIMSVNSIGQNQGFNPNMNQLGQSQGLNANTNQLGQNQGLNMNQSGMTVEQIIQESGPLPSPENVNTPQAQQALSQDVITPIMSVNSIGQNQGFNQNTNQFGQNQGFNQNANQFGQNQGFNANMNQFGQNQGLNQNMNQLGQNEGFNTNQSGMTVEQIIQESGPLPLPQNVNTPQAQQALSQNVTTPIMSVNSIGQNQGFNPNMNQLGQSQGLNVNTNQLGQNQGLNMNQPGMTGAQIIQQSGPLPSPENVNTPQAQQALSQDVTTPIMSVSSIGQNQGLNTNVNQLGQTQGLNTNMNQFGMVEYEEPKVTMSIINGSNSINGNDIVLDQEVIDFAQVDVTGDGMLDSIYLVGDRPRPNNPGYVENVGLKVRSGNKLYEVTFPYGNGYSPILFVGDLTGDGIEDVLVNIFAGGNEGFLTSYAYTFADDMPMLLSDSKIFNDIQTGTVKYADNYKVNIQTNSPPRIYTIDISDRGPDYLAMIYNENGTLIRPREGTLLGLVSLHPIDFDFNGEYSLLAVQRVIGIDNLDTLGLVQTYFTWRPAISRFTPFAQYFSILGRPL